MSMLSTRFVRKIRHRGSAANSSDPLYHGLVGYSADTTGWLPAVHSVSSPTDADTARARQLSRQGWSCVLRNSGRIVVVAQHPTGGYQVMRYDTTDSFIVETREFQPVDNRLWLRSIKRDNGSESHTPGHLLITDWFTWVRPDTTATWTRFDVTSPQGRRHELRMNWDADANWFDLPAWDNYDQLIEPTDLLARVWPSSTALPVVSP